MATAIAGYPMETNYCPLCGSSDIESRDCWNQDGHCKCNKCGAACFVIEAEDSKVDVTDD